MPARLGLALALAAIHPAVAEPVNILFVGNSFTHGRYSPALNYNAGPGLSTDNATVHDLLCPSLPCSSAKRVTPNSANTPGKTLAAQLAYLQDNPSSRYTEVRPFGGVAGIVLQLTKEAGLNYSVSLIAVSSATLAGYAHERRSEAGALALIASAKYSQIVLQDQSAEPLPATVTVNGQRIPTRGRPARFQSGVNALVDAIDAADKAAGVPYAAITLAQTSPIAAYGYTSSNPAMPIFGTSTVAQQGGDRSYAPYLGATDPIAQMASDLHSAYIGAANAYNTANPTKSHLTVALDGDAWISAINLGIAQQNPFLANKPAGQVNLWDSDPLLACCTVPIGDHPSRYGDYLNALTLFGTLTGLDPTRIAAEMNGADPGFNRSAAHALGIDPQIARRLANAAEATILTAHPVSGPSSPPPHQDAR